MKDYHAVVAGGGPAGLACAIGFAVQGLRVLVLERKEFPIDKACGEGVQPPGLAALRRLGVFEKIPADSRKEMRGIRYVCGDISAAADFAEGSGYGIRRTALSLALRERAAELGVEILRCDLQEVLPPYDEFRSNGFLPAIDARTRLIVGADGLHSRVRAWCGREGSQGAPFHRFGMRRHFSVPEHVVPMRVEVYTGVLCEAYVTPTGPASLQIAILWHEHKFKEKPHNAYDVLLKEFPALERYSVNPAGPPRGAGRLWQNVQSVIAPGVVLIGDAAGYMDAITGEGISLALEEAEAAASLGSLLKQEGLLSVEQLRAFDAAYKRITSNYRLTTRWLLRLSTRPRTVKFVVGILSARPWLMQALLSVNMGTMRPLAVLRAWFRPAHFT